MFGIMYENDGKIFEVCATLIEAIDRSKELNKNGFVVTVFDYDKDSKQYIEFYTVR